MYRSRFWCWILLIITAILFNNILSFIRNYDENHPHYTIYSDTKDLEMIQSLGNLNDGKASFEQVKKITNADFIIMEHTSNTIKGYTKYEKYIYTPIVMYVLNANSSKTGFDIIDANNGTPSKDFKTILLAFEEGKTYEDIGISESLEGEIKLAIPNENSIFYKQIEELFYITLGGSYADKDTNMELRNRVDALLNKCIKVDNIRAQISILVDKGKKKNPKDTIFIGPETIAINCEVGTFCTGSNYTDSQYSIVYMPQSVARHYDLYIKDDIKDVGIKYFDKCGFSAHTGYRTENDYNIFNTFNHTLKHIIVVN